METTFTYAVASSNRSTAMLRSKRFRLTQVPKFQLFQSSRSTRATKNQETSKILAEFLHRPGDQQEERTWRNQVALFGLWLRRFPERLHGGRHQGREASRKRLTSTYRLNWLVLSVLARGVYAGLSVASGEP